jgi:type I restriction enzyme M protein
LEDEFRDKRKARSLSESKLAELEEKWKAAEREARESQAKGDAIENAAYDLKAVNPNRVSHEDTRKPQELLDFIARKGTEADSALAKLRALIAESK